MKITVIIGGRGPWPNPNQKENQAKSLVAVIDQQKKILEKKEILEEKMSTAKNLKLRDEFQKIKGEYHKLFGEHQMALYRENMLVNLVAKQQPNFKFN